MRDVVAFATAGRPEEERDQIIGMIQQTAQQSAVHNFASGCEVADMLRASRPHLRSGARRPVHDTWTELVRPPGDR
jgi:hypothetical protein